jgi:hypothetical protein
VLSPVRRMAVGEEMADIRVPSFLRQHSASTLPKEAGQDEIDVEKQQKCGWRWIHCSPLSCGDAGDGEDGEVELRECEEEVGARVRYGNALVAAGLVFMSRYAQERLVEDRM